MRRGTSNERSRAIDAGWADLMRRAQDGDGDAYRTLLVEIVPVLRRIVISRWRSRQDVEDIVQEILMSVHMVRRTYDPGRPFMPWLMTIAYRRIADAARQRQGQNNNEILVETIPETFSFDSAKTDQDRSDDRQALRDAVAMLPEGQREAIELLKLRGLSLEEAAAVSGKSVPSLKVGVHRALKAMRTHLGRQR